MAAHFVVVVEAVVDSAAVGVGDGEHQCEHDDLREEVAAVAGVEQIHRASDESYALDEPSGDEGGDADRRHSREATDRWHEHIVVGITVQPTIASPAIQAAAAAWWATSVATPIAGQRIDREWPAKAHVASSPSPGSETAVQYTSRWTMSAWNRTSHIATARAMRIANAIPASVVVAASIDPNDDHGTRPLTSDATTSNCRNPSAAVASNERLRMLRRIG